ncbi:DUF2937 family protein [Alsobacter sp. R-9]
MFARTLSLATGLLAAVLASQAPEFAQQYRQRLGGAIDELQTVVDRFDADARQYGLDRAAAIARLSGNVDPLAAQRARDARVTAERLDALKGQQQAMAAAGPFGRIAVLASDPDPQVLRGTVRTYEPAVPTTAEGAAAAAAGLAGGWGAMRLFAWPFGRRRRVRAA